MLSGDNKLSVQRERFKFTVNMAGEGDDIILLEECEWDPSLPAIYESDVGNAAFIHRRSRQATGYKTAFNKALAALESLVNALEASPATSSLPVLKETRAAFEKATEKLLCCYTGISVLAEADDDKVAKAKKSCKEIETQANALRQRADACEMGLSAKLEALKLDEARQSIALAQAQAAASGTPAAPMAPPDPAPDVQVHVNETFKPTRLLSIKSTPEQHTEWEDQMDNHVAANGLDKWPNFRLANYVIYQCLDEHFQERIKALIREVPIGSDVNGIRAIIRRSYREVYPLLSERVALFEVRQQQGQETKDYFAALKAKVKASDIESCSVEEVLAMWAFSGITDQHIRRRISELASTLGLKEGTLPTLAQMAEAIDKRYVENSMCHIGLQPKQKGDVKAAQAKQQKRLQPNPQKQPQSQQNQQNQQKGPQPAPRLFKPPKGEIPSSIKVTPYSLDGHCHKCGKEGHMRGQCPAGTTSCPKCPGKDNHFPAACLREYWNWLREYCQGKGRSMYLREISAEDAEFADAESKQ